MTRPATHIVKPLINPQHLAFVMAQSAGLKRYHKAGADERQMRTDRILALHERGWTHQKIAEQVKVSAVYVGQIIKAAAA